MANKPVTHYYRTPATDAYPEGRLVKTSKGMERGMILDPHNGKWHGVSGIRVAEDGKADCDYLTEITEDEAMSHLPEPLGASA